MKRFKTVRIFLFFVVSLVVCNVYAEEKAACHAPWELEVSNVSTEAVELHWNAIPLASRYRVRYRVAGARWTEATILETKFMWEGLRIGADYEYEVMAKCDDGVWTDWSARRAFEFLPLECPQPQGFNWDIPEGLDIRVCWEPVPGRVGFKVRYRQVGSPWIGPIRVNRGCMPFTNLMPGWEYEMQAKTLCVDGSSSTWTRSYYFTAPGGVGGPEYPGETDGEVPTGPGSGGDDDEEGDVIVITPNPGADVVRVHTPSSSPLVQVAVYNAMGQQVMLLEKYVSDSAIDISQLASGTYYFSVIRPDASTMVKTFVKR